MSKEISLEEIRKFWPGDAPNIQSVPKYIAKYKKFTFFPFFLPKIGKFSDF